MPLIGNREGQHDKCDAWYDVPERDAREGTAHSETDPALNADLNVHDEPLALLSVSSYMFDISS